MGSVVIFGKSLDLWQLLFSGMVIRSGYGPVSKEPGRELKPPTLGRCKHLQP
jgi:hypothetical protein